MTAAVALAASGSSALGGIFARAPAIPAAVRPPAASCAGLPGGLDDQLGRTIGRFLANFSAQPGADVDTHPAGATIGSSRSTTRIERSLDLLLALERLR